MARVAEEEAKLKAEEAAHLQKEVSVFSCVWNLLFFSSCTGTHNEVGKSVLFAINPNQERQDGMA